MSNQRRSWWNPETSEIGICLMVVALFGMLFIGYRLGLSDAVVFVSAPVAATIAGIVFNVAAHHYKWKKIHWVDFVWSDLWFT